MTEPDADSDRPAGADAHPVAARAGASPAAADPPRARQSRAKDHSPWNWLLFAPIVVPLLTPLFNMDAPRLGGLPAFYWLQLAFIALGVGTTTLVYQMTKKRG